MNKHEALAAINVLIHQANLSKQDVLTIFNETPAPTPTDTPRAARRKLSLESIAYYIGGGIVLAGLWTLVALNWSDMPVDARLIVSFGLAVMTYLAGVGFERALPRTEAAASLYFVAIATLPVGLATLLDIVVFDPAAALSQAAIAFICAVCAAGLYIHHKKSVLLLAATLYSTWGLAALLSHILEYAGYDADINGVALTSYYFITAGFSYFCLAQLLHRTRAAALTGTLLGLGLVYTLVAGLVLEINATVNPSFWTFFYPALLAGGMYASVRLARNALLVLSTIFLVIYILYVTSRYFSDSLGWPFALMLAGGMIIGTTILAGKLRARLTRPA